MIYVIIQFSAFFYLLVRTDFSILGGWHFALFAAALIVGIFAARAMRITNIRILPDLKKNHRLVGGGIYQYIRHPMYVSVMIFALGLWLGNPDFTGAFVVLILGADLFFKAKKEEQFLHQRFGDDYANYQQKTGGFFPKIFGKF